jgi:hypothetical protein
LTRSQVVGLGGIGYDYDDLGVFLVVDGRVVKRAKRERFRESLDTKRRVGHTQKRDQPGGTVRSNSCIKLPLYAPSLSKLLNVALILALAQRNGTAREKDNLKEAVSWISDCSRYETLLRGTPRNRRKRFVNTDMISEIPRLLEAGILKQAPQGSIKAWCRMFGLEEPDKNRRRLIIEPRDLNNAWRSVYPKCSLPNISDILKLVGQAEELTQGDMKCYFYQIPLSEAVQAYFGVQVGTQFFTLTRLPMGATISVFVANALASTIHREAVGSAPKITYLDNLISAGNHTRDLERVAQQVGATFGSYEVGKTMDVLGINVDVTRKRVKLSEKFMTKHTPLLREVLSTTAPQWSNAKLWKVLGIIFRFVEVSRRPLADSFGLMQKIRKVARKLALEQTTWYEQADILQADLIQIQKLCRETLNGEEYDAGEAHDGEPRTTDDILFTDASTRALGFVHISGREISVGQWKLSEEEKDTPIHELEAQALLKAMSLIPTYKRIIVLVDSQILYHGLVKGRSNARGVNRAAGNAATRSAPAWVGWIPSEMNWADDPSRCRRFDLKETCDVRAYITPVRQWHTVPRAPPERHASLVASHDSESTFV